MSHYIPVPNWRILHENITPEVKGILRFMLGGTSFALAIALLYYVGATVAGH